jgi:hypothetical protein
MRVARARVVCSSQQYDDVTSRNVRRANLTVACAASSNW